jgi:hypothetical protein
VALGRKGEGVAVAVHVRVHALGGVLPGRRPGLECSCDRRKVVLDALFQGVEDFLASPAV